MRMNIFIRIRIGAGILVALAAVAAGAQLPNASAAATGLSNAYVARARGYDAVAWNPANLALPGNPAFSLTAIALNGSSGLDPISLNDLGPYSGKDLPQSQRETWLRRVTQSGGENGRVDGGITGIAMSAGPFAVQVAASVAGSTKLSPDAFEAIMFGNAGRTGEVKSLSLAGSNARVSAFSTAGLSYGFTAGGDSRSDSRLSFGVTGKYVLGNALAIAQDQGTTTGTDAVAVNMPFVYSNPDSAKVIGKGVGMDLGFAWRARKLTLAGTVQNVFNTFAWDESKLVSKAGTAVFDGDNNNSDGFKNDAPFSQAPAALRQKVADDKFSPIIAGGFAYAWRPSVIVSGGFRQQLGDALLIGPKMSVSGGIDYRWLPLLRLRGGASLVTDGWGYSAGLGIELGHYELGVGASLLTVNSGKEPGITVNLLSIH